MTSKEWWTRHIAAFHKKPDDQEVLWTWSTDDDGIIIRIVQPVEINVKIGSTDIQRMAQFNTWARTQKGRWKYGTR